MAEKASKNKPQSISGAGFTGKRPSGEDGDGEKRQKLSFGISKTTTASKPGLQIKLNASKSNTSKPLLKATSVFNDESDEEPEEMPPEARRRMRNIGRDTPTSAGPNSFGKTKHGFINVEKVFQKNLNSDTDPKAKEVTEKSKST